MFRKVLVPLDRSPLAEQAIGRGAAIARAASADMDVVLVHQPSAFAGFNDSLWSAGQVTDDDKYLETIVEALASGASVRATHAVLHGDVVEMICARARDVAADLIVMTSHGRTGLSGAWLGNVADGVVRRSATPVLLLHPIEGKTDPLRAERGFKHLLVPLDGTAPSTEILGSAVALAQSSGARITLLRVTEPVMRPRLDMAFPVVVAPASYRPSLPDEVATRRLAEDAKEQLSEIAQTLAEQGSTPVNTHVVVHWPVARAILDFARGKAVDAIAMSTHGRGASRVFVGSIADKVLRASEVPVLIHRPIGSAGSV